MHTKNTRTWASTITALVVALVCLSVSLAGVFAQDESVPAQEKIGSNLAQLKRGAEALPEGAALFSPTTMVVDGQVAIQAIASGDPEALLVDLEALGLEQGVAAAHSVGGLFPIDAIQELAGLETLQFAEVAHAMTTVGDVTSQGDVAMYADDARANYGVNGSGIVVGVLSDTYNCLGGADDDVASGDLPAGVTVLEEADCQSCSEPSDEGRAMMQLIHDVAPGATLLFHTAYPTEENFAQGIRDLAAAGADVIVDDVIYRGEAFFQDDLVAQAVDEVVGSGVTYLSSAGNMANQSYESPFTRSSQILTVLGTQYVLHDFIPGPGVDYTQTMIIQPGANLTFWMQWDDPHGSISSPIGADSDLAMFLTFLAPNIPENSGARPADPICDDHALGALAAYSDSSNIDNDPYEIVGGTYTGTTTYCMNLLIGIRRTGGGPDPGLVKVIYDYTPDRLFFEQYEPWAPTVFGQFNSAAGAGVGAAFYGYTPAFGQSPPLPETFTSLGGIPILFNIAGSPITPITREQPLITAPDGANTTFFGRDISYDTDTFPNFFGTSAAAPHAAAVAALMLNCDASLTPGDILDVLQDTAVDMETGGFDYTTGYGLIDANAALAAIAVPDMAVLGNSVVISDGDTTPNVSDNTDLGEVSVGITRMPVTFTIQNTASNCGTLNLNGTPRVQLSGSHAGDFGVVTQPVGSLSAGQTTTFQLTCTPSALGTRLATISIPNDDPDEAPYNFAVQCTGVGAPEIDVRGNGISIPDGDITPQPADNTDFGVVNVDTGLETRTFSIHNTGNDDLTIANIGIAGAHSADFQASTPLSSTVVPGGNTSFTVTCNPNAAGLRQASVMIVNNDANENPYTYAIQCMGESTPVPEPEMDVTGNGFDILDGDTTPILSDNTDFGNVPLEGTGSARTFVIHSTGAASLTLGGISITGPGAGVFTVTDAPTSPVAPGGSTDLEITCTPIVAGLHAATVSIANNDSDENPYDFAIQCTGVQTVPVQEIDVRGNSVSIVSGDMTPDPADNTDFGSIVVGSGTINRTFSIHNVGLAPLAVNGVTLEGAGASVFSVTTLPSSPVAEGGSTDFAVTCNPGAAGVYLATVRIDNNDYDENPYTFAIQCTGESVPEPEPEMNVTGNGFDIPDGDTTPILSDNTDFGNVPLGGVGSARTFVIHNTGAANLTLDGASITGAGAGMLMVTGAPTSPVAPGSSTDLEITCTPVVAGLHAATVSIANNDSDENPYDFAVQCTGESTPEPEIDVTGNGISIVNGDATPAPADNTDFGSVMVGSETISKTFSIHNIGLAPLAVSGVTLEGAGASVFSVTTLPGSPVAEGSSTDFAVTCNPGAAGVYGATVRIANDDADENPYSFAIQCTGTEEPPPYVEPPLVCETGELIALVDVPVTLRATESPHSYDTSINVAEGSAGGGFVVLSMVGHPEVGCPYSDHRYCSQDQTGEAFNIVVGGSHLGGDPSVPDHGNHQWQAFYFPFDLDAGATYPIHLEHAYSSGNVNSVSFKLGFCAVKTSDPPPVAVDDAYEVDQDTALNIPAPGVLGNDSDPNGDPLTANLVSGPGQGTVILNGDGSFVYTPTAGFSGQDSFSYQACDPDMVCDTATVTITVKAFIPPPYEEPPLACDTGELIALVDVPVTLRNHREPRSYDTSINVAEGSAGGGFVVLSMVGHPEVGCPYSDHRYCSQNQPQEAFNITVGDSHLGGDPSVPDHGNHQWQAFYFPFDLEAGVDYPIHLQHVLSSGEANSVSFKLGYCAVPEPDDPVITVDVVGIGNFQSGAGCTAALAITLDHDSPVTGNMHVWNDSYDAQGDIYNLMTLNPGINSYAVTLGGRDWEYQTHRLWFQTSDDIWSNIVEDLICPGFPTSVERSVEGEDGTGGEAIMPRSNASNEHTHWVRDGQTLTVPFEALPIGGLYRVTVHYSNDNHDLVPGETVEVRIGSHVIGSFEAVDTHIGDPWGVGWNIFASHTFDPVHLIYWNDSVAITVSGGDGEGVEIDRIVVESAW
jgi:hypothetical protein